MQSTEDVQSILRTIKDFRRRGQYIAGHDYISSLAQTLHQEKVVAIEIAQLYLVQGHYIRAWDALSLPKSTIFAEGNQSGCFTSEICQADSVCLALLSAYTGISRYGRLKTALCIADRVYDAWLAPNLKTFPAELSSQIPKDVREDYVSTVIPQWLALQKSSHGWDRDDVTICESRISIEFYYHKIRVVAAEQGLLDEVETKRTAVDRFDTLREWTVSHGRLHEARHLIYARIDLAKNNAEDLTVLQEFLRTLTGTNHILDEAQTCLDLARCMIRSGDPRMKEEAQQHIRKAEELFKKGQHSFGLLDLMDMQVIEQQAIKQLEDVLQWKLDSAEFYFTNQCYQQGIKCLIFGIPLSHDIGKPFEQIQSIIERARKEITFVGALFLEQVVFMHAVSQTLIMASEYGYARQCLEEYLTRLPPEISPKTLGLLYTSLRGAHLNLGNFDKALFYAEQALETFRTGASYIDISDAALYLALTKQSIGRRLPPKPDMRQFYFTKSIDLLTGWTETDRTMNYHSGEVSKYVSLASAENDVGTLFHDKQAFARSDQWLDRARCCSETYGIPLSDVHELEISREIRLQNFDKAVEIAHDYLRNLQAVQNSSSFALAQEMTRVSNTIFIRFLHRAKTEFGQPGVDYRAISQDLFEAMKLASNALDLYRAGGSEMVVVAVGYLYNLLCHLPKDSNHDLLKVYLTEAEKTEIFCDTVRRSSASTRKMSSLLEKRSIISGNAYRELYSNAIEACLQLEEPSAAWLWIQKGKARALSDIFGVRALVPDAMMRAIEADKEAQSLYEREQMNAEIALRAGPLDYIHARRKVESDRTEMRKHPLLKQVLDIREGAYNINFEESELNEAFDIFKVSRRTVKYVDWFIPRATENEDQAIVLLVRQPNGITSSKNLTITVKDVEAWIKCVFEFPEEAEPPLRRGDGNRRLRELNALVRGLEELTDEDDLLILSPSGPLHRVPIHGLLVSNRTLIERNPIIYSSSAAIFRQSHMRAAAQASKQNASRWKASLLAVYEEQTKEDVREWLKICEHADMLSVNFPFEIQKGTAVTKRSFQEVGHHCRWVHYHGHAIFNQTEVLRSCLVLSDGVNQANTASATVSDAKDLTVAEIFNIDMLDNAPHFTVIACNSGAQDIAPGDEPLGIIPALLYAGATSVLGTLWPVESQVARKFSQIFYEDLSKQIEAQKQKPKPHILDLATALRTTVRTMMDRKITETKQPLHWAPYVLHGAWCHVIQG